MSERSRNQPLGLAGRTRKNLRFLIQAADDGADVHPITELTNSLLALIVFPWEKRIADNALNVRLEQLPPQWPKWQMRYEHPKTLRNLLERLRNAIGHGNVEYSSESRRLTEVEVTFTDRGKTGRDLKWSGIIGAADLLQFCLAFGDLLETESAKDRNQPN